MNAQTEQTATDLASIARAAGLSLIDSSSGINPKYAAQRAMQGRTHYFDDDTLRYFHSRVLSSTVTDGGILHGAVTSDALDHRNSARGFRYVIHDLTGHCIDRPDLEASYRTSEQARKAMWAKLEELDARDVLRNAIIRQQRRAEREVAQAADALAMLDA